MVSLYQTSVCIFLLLIVRRNIGLPCWKSSFVIKGNDAVDICPANLEYSLRNSLSSIQCIFQTWWEQAKLQNLQQATGREHPSSGFSLWDCKLFRLGTVPSHMSIKHFKHYISINTSGWGHHISNTIIKSVLYSQSVSHYGCLLGHTAAFKIM